MVEFRLNYHNIFKLSLSLALLRVYYNSIFTCAYIYHVYIYTDYLFIHIYIYIYTHGIMRIYTCHVYIYKYFHPFPTSSTFNLHVFFQKHRHALRGSFRRGCILSVHAPATVRVCRRSIPTSLGQQTPPEGVPRHQLEVELWKVPRDGRKSFG